MKNPERVAELLAELRELAENDFERHRIDVLERDLTDPPTVEAIDEKHYTFAGMLFKKHHRDYYTSNVCLHRIVWAYYHGEIPNNYEIHHIDRNPSNNDIKNLECLSPEEHRQKHSSRKNVEKVCVICGKPFSAKSELACYCSPRCSHHGTTYKKICRRCGKSFVTTHKEVVYCSTQCANRDIADKIKTVRTCALCGKEFVGSGRFCSSTCYNRNFLKNQPREERICVICGKPFSARIKSARQTCSGTCSTKLNWQHRNLSINTSASSLV